MSYCARSDIEGMFGVENVKKWADLDNDQDAAKIANRVALAVTQADRHIDRRFRRSKYAVPLVALGGYDLAEVTDVACRWAGVWLYENRGLRDVDSEGKPVNLLTRHAKYVQDQINRYLSGRDDLPCVLNTAGGVASPTGPFAV